MLGGDVVCCEDAVAGRVLQVGAVGALQHQGVWMGVGAEAGDGGVLLRLLAQQGGGGDSLTVL